MRVRYAAADFIETQRLSAVYQYKSPCFAACLINRYNAVYIHRAGQYINIADSSHQFFELFLQLRFAPSLYTVGIGSFANENVNFRKTRQKRGVTLSAVPAEVPCI